MHFFENKNVCYPLFEKFLLLFVQPGQTQDLRSYVRTIFCTCRIPIVTKVVIKLVNLLFNEYWNTTESWEIVIFMLIDRWLTRLSSKSLLLGKAKLYRLWRLNYCNELLGQYLLFVEKFCVRLARNWYGKPRKNKVEEL